MTRSTLRGRRVRALLASVALAAALPTSALGAHGHPNPALPYVVLQPAAAGGTVIPLINSGQTFDGTMFEGIPDGIGVVPISETEVDLYVTFEQSHVPFLGFADFEDSSIQRARLDLDERQLTELEEVLPPSAGFIRFCTAFMAGPEHGFSQYTFFANEESNDIIDVPAGAPYGADPAVAPYRQAGYSVYLNTSTGAYGQISRMGRHNHENTVFVPGGWKQMASLSTDDTFNAPSSQLYLHTANDEKQIFTDKGQLWAFQVTATDEGAVDPFDAFNDANDFLEINPGDAWSGRFIHVPTDVARGLTGEPPQTALENWSNANNVFQFVRLEDVAYDPDDPRTVYIADTGTDRLVESETTGRLFRGPSGTGVANPGRIFKFVLNEKDPRIVDEFSILLEASSIGMRNPDNLDVGHSSIMVQEDASSAKIWRYDKASPAWTHVASVTHPVSPAAGESSGIVDMSAWLGDGWWALDVQSHVNAEVNPEILTYTVPITGQELLYQQRREDGQLLLMLIPGS
jgi:hypothetical protein